ncbi:hypothetical protein LCFBJUUZ_CDS0082 [Staphylococcus phage PG-2021_76]
MISKFNKFKNKLLKQDINKFMPHEFSNFTKIDNDETFQFLILLVEKGDLLLRWKIKCTNCGNFKVVDRGQVNEDYINLQDECDGCHIKYRISKNNLYPFFEIK